MPSEINTIILKECRAILTDGIDEPSQFRLINSVAKILHLDPHKKPLKNQIGSMQKAFRMIDQVLQTLNPDEEASIRVDRSIAILHQLYSNLGLTLKKVFTQVDRDETECIDEALSQESSLIHSVGGLPNFIGSKESVDEVEDDDYLDKEAHGHRLKPINNLFYFSEIAKRMHRNSVPLGESKQEKTTLTVDQLQREALKRANIKLDDGKIKSNEDVNHFKLKIKEILNEHNRDNTDEAISDESKIARNLLRYILRGSPAMGGEAGFHYKEALAALEECLAVEARPDLLKGLRVEIDIVFKNAADWIVGQQAKAKTVALKRAFENNEKQFIIFIHGLLALYPFISPDPSKSVSIPQKVNGHWQAVQYNLRKLDISPQNNLLGSLIEDQDRIYAYGLEPDNDEKSVDSHLLLMGTPQPTGQGSDLAVLYNFGIGYSVGEAHETLNTDEWIKKQKTKVMVSGQSKGATMAMITAARFPEKVSAAHALNPTALSYWTLKRLQSKWNATPELQRPGIHVYAQHGDPVFPLDHGFLPGTKIYRIFPTLGEDRPLSNFKKFVPAVIQRSTDAHIQNFSGQASVTILEGNIAKYNNSRKREFFSDVKTGISAVNFPNQYVNIAAGLAMRKAERAMGSAKPILKPVGMIGRVVGGVVSLAVFLVTVPLVFIGAGIKAVIRKLTGARSDYQKATPLTRPDINAPKGSTAHLMALRDSKNNKPLSVAMNITGNSFNEEKVREKAEALDSSDLTTPFLPSNQKMRK